MEMQLYTLLRRRAGDLRVIGDTRRPLGVLPPVWALVNGLWLTALGMAGLLATAVWLDPRLAPPVWAALATLSILEGSAIEAAERRLRGWREVALVEARSPEGAEEQWLTAAPAPGSAQPAPGAPGPAQSANPDPADVGWVEPTSTPTGWGQPNLTPAPSVHATPTTIGWMDPTPAAADADGPGPIAQSLRALADTPTDTAAPSDTPASPSETPP